MQGMGTDGPPGAVRFLSAPTASMLTGQGVQLHLDGYKFPSLVLMAVDDSLHMKHIWRDWIQAKCLGRLYARKKA